MSPPPDNASQDTVSHVEDNPPEQSARPLGEQSVRPLESTVVYSETQCNPPVQLAGPLGELSVRSLESIVVPAPQNEGSLKYISKYLVQYVPVKPKKPSSSSCVTGARILTSEECAQIIFECKEKKRKENEARKVVRD